MGFREELDAMCKQFAKDSQRGDAVACTSIYTDDVVFYPNDRVEESIHGRPAMTAFFQQAMKDGLKVEEITTLCAEANQNLGYAVQTFQSTIGPGMVMLALRRQAEGWRICNEAMVAIGAFRSL